MTMNERFKIIKKNNFVELVNDDITSVYIENGKEIVELKELAYLEKYICEKFNFAKFKKIILLMYLVPSGNFNVVTDKKGIWGLTGQVEGIYQNTYLCGSGKVYFGITDNFNEKSLNGVVINATVFMPTNSVISYENIFQIFATAKFDLISSSDEENNLLEKVQKAIPNSIVLLNAGESIKLFGDKIEKRL